MYKLEVLVVFLSVSNLTKGQDEPECYEPGECTESLFVGDWTTSNVQGCLNECKGLDDCMFFTYYEADQMCLGFTECVVFDSATCTDCYSGSRDCEDVQCSVVGRCEGILVEDVIASSNEECLSICQANSECQWVTYDYDNSNCFQLEDCQVLDVTCDQCLSSQRHCSGEESSIHLRAVVMSGSTSSGIFRDIEVVDLENPILTCEPLEQYPMETYAMTAAYIDGKIKSCGGVDAYDLCFDYNFQTATWSNAESLLYERYRPHSSLISGQWLVSGDNESPASSQTEIWDGNLFIEGPVIPSEVYQICQVTINDTHVFYSDNVNMEYFLLDYTTQTTTESEPIDTNHPYGGPYSICCGLINNSDNGQEIVIVGYGFSDILNLGSMTWRPGPMLTYGYDYGSAQYGDTFVLFGGNTGSLSFPCYDTIVKFDNVNYDWITLEQTLQHDRCESTVVMVPDDLVTCL